MKSIANVAPLLLRKRAMMHQVVLGTEPAENLGLDEEGIFKLFGIRVGAA